MSVNYGIEDLYSKFKLLNTAIVKQQELLITKFPDARDKLNIDGKSLQAYTVSGDPWQAYTVSNEHITISNEQWQSNNLGISGDKPPRPTIFNRFGFGGYKKQKTSLKRRITNKRRKRKKTNRRR
jgi:hypothetical protein